MNRITALAEDDVFVFGSNLAGKHFGGAARDAHDLFGAEMGVGEGMTGKCYALPTLDTDFEKRSLHHIKESVGRLLQYAAANPTKRFIITPVGCGIAGFKVSDIAPMFLGSPSNCIMPPEFE